MKMKKLDILKYLERKDKWYLGGGNRLIWTPPFPFWLDHPGFWDKAHYYNYEIEPVFTWTILDEDGKEIHLRGVDRTWNPASLRTRFDIQDSGNTRVNIEESKCCLPNDVLTSVVDIKNNSRRSMKLIFIAWTIQPNYPSKSMNTIKDVSVGQAGIAFTKNLYRAHAPILPIGCAFGLNRKIESYCINLSEGQAIQPHWRFTPFAEKIRNGRLKNEIKLSGVNNDGLIFIALQTSLEIKANSESNVSVIFSAASTKQGANKNLRVTAKLKDPVKESERNWNDYFKTVPYFECQDEYITRYYWYRWYGLRLMTMDGNEGNYKSPTVCEGIGYFRAPISYSAMCHMFENRWRHDPKLAKGSLLTFIQNQRTDGGFRGYIDVNYYRQEMFYHANWGRAVLELDRIHPDKKFLKKIYPALVKYANYFDRERDAEGSGLYDIDNHYETGQEYMHRYIAVDQNADKDNWGKLFRLKGVDVTVYLYELKKALVYIAERINRPETEMAKWRISAEKIRNAVLDTMWDSREEMFFDVNPKTGKRTNVKAAVCFYPYMTDIVSEKHLHGLKRHLFNPKKFWTRYPVPSSSADDPYFSSDAEWKGKRMNCPWNGRVWPMTNSHIAEAIMYSARRFNDRGLEEKGIEFIRKFIGMMFLDGDVKLPNCFEHYNPFTGEPSVYRGVDDYQHSWVNDLIISYIAGLHPGDDRIEIGKSPHTMLPLIVDGIKIKNHTIKVASTRKQRLVAIDGHKFIERNNEEKILLHDR
jgi:hypothetical protein